MFVFRDRSRRFGHAYKVIVVGDTDNVPAAKPCPSGWSGGTASTVATAKRKTRMVSVSALDGERFRAGGILGDLVYGNEDCEERRL